MNDINYHDSSVEGVRLFGSAEAERPRLVKIEGRAADKVQEANLLQNELTLAMGMLDRAAPTPLPDAPGPNIYRMPVDQVIDQEGYPDAA
jgi:hypothetical protein